MRTRLRGQSCAQRSLLALSYKSFIDNEMQPVFGLGLGIFRDCSGGFRTAMIEKVVSGTIFSLIWMAFS
jgi:hypothetical protein